MTFKSCSVLHGKLEQAQNENVVAGFMFARRVTTDVGNETLNTISAIQRLVNENIVQTARMVLTVNMYSFSIETHILLLLYNKQTLQPFLILNFI